MSLLASLLLAAAAAPPAPPPARVELPIAMSVGRGGARRFSVTISVNGRPVEAGLDTGSTGLRLLAPLLPAGGGGADMGVSFNVGVELHGPAVRADVGFAALPPAPIRVQRIDRIGCRKDVPACPGAGADPATFRIMGDGVAGQGFAAILGIGMRDERLGHPLVQAGVTRWIVDLPRTPGETGRLVLSPTDAEVARYTQVRFLPGRNELAGCIVATASKVCAPTMVDSGAPGISVFGGAEGDVLPQGTEATLMLGDGTATASMPVTIGRRDQAAMMRHQPARRDAKTSLSFGIAPYLHWSILYDARARTLGVADR